MTLLAAVVLVAGLAPPAAAANGIVVANGVTQPVFSLADAVRETVFVESRMDSDRDGRRDRITVDVVRPAESAHGMRVATVMEASPYYGPRLPRTAESVLPESASTLEELVAYYVPRGYAVAGVAMQGTNRSDGCPTTGGREDTASAVAAIDWLNGRAEARYPDGRPARAAWATGRVGMVGLSYDGTLANAAAAEGVEGLTTIVPISAISSWYSYARDQGIARSRGWADRYPRWQAMSVINPAAVERCASVLAELAEGAADDTADYTRFWAERDYRRGAGRLSASVLMVQGRTDFKVLGDQFAEWWRVLAERGVPRKLWYHDGDHIHPRQIRPEQWQHTLHRWLDHWLYDVPNGIMAEPTVDLQRPDGTWTTLPDWPGETTERDLWLDASGALTDRPGPPATRTFTDDAEQWEHNLIAAPETPSPHRLAHLTAPLTAPVRLAGQPKLTVTAAVDQTRTPLSAVLVDYGPQGTKPVVVSRGSLDTRNRYTLTAEVPLIPGHPYRFAWHLQAADYVFKPGHRIGVVLMANNAEHVAPDPAGATVTVNLERSHLSLPIGFTCSGGRCPTG